MQDDDVSTAATSATRAPSARFNLFIQGAAMDAMATYGNWEDPNGQKYKDNYSIAYNEVHV